MRFFSTGNSPTKPPDDSSRINSKESDSCSWLGQSGLRLIFLLAKANRFRIRIIISNLRNGISLNILSGLLSVVMVWNMIQSCLFCLRGFITSQCSFVVHMLHASLWSTVRLLFFCCLVLRFYKMRLGLDSLVWKTFTNHRTTAVQHPSK